MGAARDDAVEGDDGAAAAGAVVAGSGLGFMSGCAAALEETEDRLDRDTRLSRAL
jgi:hypothetical protein